MEQRLIYIDPEIKLFSSLDHLLPHGDEDLDLPADPDKVQIKDLFNHNRLMVVGEPGYGKSTLLCEMFKKAQLDAQECIKIDAKSLAEKDIINVPNLDLLPGKKITLFIDALDEIRLEDFADTTAKILAFAYNNADVRLVLSCRSNFLNRFKRLFVGHEFMYALLMPFTMEQVTQYLVANNISEDEANIIILTISFKHRKIVIQTPRYLELLLSYVQEFGVKDVAKLTRSELFEYFIYKKLELEDNKLSTQNKHIVKRLLESIALTMEIYQTNALTKDELMTCFDELKSDLKFAFMQLGIQTLYDNTLIKDNLETIEFDNTEFQEYLAAKELVRLKKSAKDVFDLSVDSQLREIIPSWFNTLTFAVDLDISLLKPLLDFNQLMPNKLQYQEFHRFITSTNVERLPSVVKMEIFENIFTYYQDILHWIDSDVSDRLSFYFDSSQSQLLKIYVNKKRYTNQTERNVNLANLASILGHLFERSKLSSAETNYWKTILTKLAREKKGNGVIQRHALHSLAVLKDEALISKVAPSWHHPDELVRNEFLTLCTDVNPNNLISVRYFIEGTKQKNIFARYGLYKVDKKFSIEHLVNAFINDRDFLLKFIDYESVFKDKDNIIIKNLSAVLDDCMYKQLIELILKAFELEHGYWAERSDFINNIFTILANYNSSFIFDILQSILSKGSDKLLFRYEKAFSSIIKEEHVEPFIAALKDDENKRWIAVRVLQFVKFSDRAAANSIYEKGRKLFKKEYAAAEKQWKKNSNKPPESDRLYREFKLKLELDNGKFSSDLFKFFLGNADKLAGRLSSDDTERMIWLLKDSIFSKFDPGEQKLTITMKSGNSTSYTTHAWISLFGDSIKAAVKLDMDVTEFKSQIISYIPFAYHDDLEAIFKLVKKLELQDISRLLSVYQEKKSDLWLFMPDSFIRACSKYNIDAAGPILQEFIETSTFSKYDRIRALEVKEQVCPDWVYLYKIFNEYKDTAPDIAEIGQKANELLIDNYKDKDAINWRFNQIKKRARAFTTPKGVHAVDHLENELHSFEFAKSLTRIKDVQLQNAYLDLLLFSFKILTKPDYWAYATYIWQIVINYFENLKEYRSYVPIKVLEDFVSKNSNEEGINWFKLRLKDLKRSYMTHLGKPASYIECILKYNALKCSNNTDISSPQEFYIKVKSLIDTDLRRWIEGEGAYRLIVEQKIKKAHNQNYEELIQRTIKAQFENILYKNGFSQFEILREPQLLDGKRVDFILFYGFLGPIILEIKLGSSGDLQGSKQAIKKKDSFASMQRYISGYNTKFGIFLVLDNRPVTAKNISHHDFLGRIRDVFDEIKYVDTIGIRC